MKTLTVAFSRPISKLALGSLLIRWFEKAPFSHAVLRWGSPNIDRDLVYQASHGSVHFISGANFDSDNQTVEAYELDYDEISFYLAVQKCVDYSGVAYGYLELFGMAFERITGLRNPFRDQTKTFVCSELVGDILKLREGSLINIDLELAGPKLLRDCVAQLPGVRRVK